MVARATAPTHGRRIRPGADPPSLVNEEDRVPTPVALPGQVVTVNVNVGGRDAVSQAGDASQRPPHYFFSTFPTSL